MVAQRWEEVADYALRWASEYVASHPETTAEVTPFRTSTA
jgi:hypothetical protein